MKSDIRAKKMLPMIRRSAFLIWVLVIPAVASFAQSPIPSAHAHNDYEHDRPLLDALDHGFTSVEADLHLIEGKLYVAHDRPKDLSQTPLFEDIYLAPLKKRVSDNNGRVYPGYNESFFLMVDFKTNGTDTYKVLVEVLRKYADMLSIVDTENMNTKPITVFISGNRPIQEVLNDHPKYAGLDGRPADLKMSYDSSIMPVVSENYRRFLSWRGEGKVNKKELRNLKLFIKEAHSQGKKVRLWAAPDTPACWEFLLALNVDLINTDKLEEFAAFMSN